MTENCGICRYWINEYGNVHTVQTWHNGICRRHSPVYEKHDYNQDKTAKWPVVNNLFWCGDFECGVAPDDAQP